MPSVNDRSGSIIAGKALDTFTIKTGARHSSACGIMQSVFSLASRRKAAGESAQWWIATVS